MKLIYTRFYREPDDRPAEYDTMSYELEVGPANTFRASFSKMKVQRITGVVLPRGPPKRMRRQTHRSPRWLQGDHCLAKQIEKEAKISPLPPGQIHGVPSLVRMLEEKGVGPSFHLCAYYIGRYWIVNMFRKEKTFDFPDRIRRDRPRN